MNEQIEKVVGRCPVEATELFDALRRTLYESVCVPPEETLWAGMPSYLCGPSFVRLIPFKDHVNIEAKAVPAHRDELTGYQITPKGMLQVFVGQKIPYETLKRIFAETLNG